MNHVLKLVRPLAVLDLETTGAAPEIDRIIEIAILLVYPDGKEIEYSTRVNPGIGIPVEATNVHGIRDEDVKDKPSFRAIALEVAAVLKDCDIAGFNVAAFDLRLLANEFKRAGVEFSSEGRSIIDAQRIFHVKEPRDLRAAGRFYLNTGHEDAHAAMADVSMSWRVLKAQLERYPELPRGVAELHDFCNPVGDRYLDSGRKFEWRYGEAAFTFGKFQGRLLKEIAKEKPDYFQWMVSSDFPTDTKKIAKNAMDGEFPKPKPKGVK
jgi:DNA polymerase-3 subunit epsilon